MRVISVDLPETIIRPLDTWLSRALELSRANRPPCTGGKYRDRGEWVTGEAARAGIDWAKHVGFPVDSWDHDFTTKGHTALNLALDNALQREIGYKHPALKVVYPPGGYIGWHDNRNAAGCNVVFTWSDEPATGYWRHVEPATGEIVTIPDVPGWHLKMGLYGRTGRPGDERLQHCAWAGQSWRATVGFIVKSGAMWDDIVEELSG